MRKAKNTEEAQKVDFKDDRDIAYGWIQWKGTDVCMDINCSCGELTHVDGDFAYHVKCAYCGKVYYCNGHIEFIELEEEPDHCLLEGEKDLLEETKT